MNLVQHAATFINEKQFDAALLLLQHTTLSKTQIEDLLMEILFTEIKNQLTVRQVKAAIKLANYLEGGEYVGINLPDSRTCRMRYRCGDCR